MALSLNYSRLMFNRFVNDLLEFSTIISDFQLSTTVIQGFLMTCNEL